MGVEGQNITGGGLEKSNCSNAFQDECILLDDDDNVTGHANKYVDSNGAVLRSFLRYKARPN